MLATRQACRVRYGQPDRDGNGVVSVGASFAREERVGLCDLLTEVGPHAPTLCEGWQARDLAAHLILRERRLDAAAGILLRPLAARTARIQRALATGTPYARLIEQIRTGPPRWSPYGLLPGVDGAVNAIEFFVHHEDVRRAAPGARPRRLGIDTQRMLWSRAGMLARMALRSAPSSLAVTLHWSDEERPDGPRRTVRRGTRPVEVRGGSGDLVLWLAGRTGAAHVELVGEQDATRAATAAVRPL